MKWNPLKWCLLGLLTLFLCLWLGHSSVSAQARPDSQDVFKVGGNLAVTESQVVNDAFAIGGNLIVQPGAVVEGDAFAIGGDVQLEDDATVEGDTFAIGGRVLRAESAVINGNEFTLLEQWRGVFERFGVLGTLYLSNVAFWVVSFVVAAIAGLLLLLLLPGHIDAIATAVYARPFLSLVYGIGGVAALIILAVLISGSVLGAIVLPLANLAALLTGLFGGSAICVWLGKRLNSKNPDAHFQHFWLGLILLFIISLIPIVGGLLVSLMALFGFGATLLARYGTQTAADLPMLLDRLEQQTD